MAAQPKQRYTPQEYLALERRAEYKSEYVDGEIFAMAGGSKEHNLITGSIYAHLYQKLGDGPCTPFVTDLRVRVFTRRYYYPDVVVVCGEADFEDDEVDTLLNPTVVFEVLSKSTEDYDKGEKADFYRALPSLTDLIFVSQRLYHVQHYSRRSDDTWLLMQYRTLDATVNLPTIGCQLTLAEIYRKLKLDPDLDD